MPMKMHHDQLPELNLTSMIDVLFLLIIFFIAGTQFTERERKIQLEVPRVGTAQNLPNAAAQRVIHVYADGEVVVDGKTFTLDELRSQLADEVGRTPELSVLVRGDGAASLQDAAAVLAACADAGVRDMGMSAKPQLRR